MCPEEVLINSFLCPAFWGDTIEISQIEEFISKLNKFRLVAKKKIK